MACMSFTCSPPPAPNSHHTPHRMRFTNLLLAATALIGSASAFVLPSGRPAAARAATTMNAASIYDFTVKDAAGKDFPLKKLSDKKAILVVNVASQCCVIESSCVCRLVLLECGRPDPRIAADMDREARLIDNLIHPHALIEPTSYCTHTYTRYDIHYL